MTQGSVEYGEGWYETPKEPKGWRISKIVHLKAEDASERRMAWVGNQSSVYSKDEKISGRIYQWNEKDTGSELEGSVHPKNEKLEKLDGKLFKVSRSEPSWVKL